MQCIDLLQALKNVSDLLVEAVIKAEEAKTGVKVEAGAEDDKKKDNL